MKVENIKERKVYRSSQQEENRGRLFKFKGKFFLIAVGSVIARQAGWGWVSRSILMTSKRPGFNRFRAARSRY